MVDVLTVYIGITVVFSVLLFVMAVTGGLFDIGADVGGVDVGGVDLGDVGHDVAADAGQFSGAGISPLSLPILFAFGAFFGAFGTVLESFQSLPSISVPFVAAGASAVITALVYYFLVQVFAKSQVTTTYDLKDLVGTRGEVTVPVKPGVRGQVLVVTDARGRTLLSAISTQDLKTGDRVQITGVEGNALVVEKV
ncbi:MAG: NfeD family protein [Candidatus Thermoplasmatota archaeon]